MHEHILVLELVKTFFLGVLISGATAVFLIALGKKGLIPKYLQNFVILGLVFAIFALSNHIQAESGLPTVTLFGIILANQHVFEVSHVVEFKENLRVLIISGLFVVLAARLDWGLFNRSTLKAFCFSPP